MKNNLKRAFIFKAVISYFSGDVDMFEDYTDDNNQIWISKEDLKNKCPIVELADKDSIELLKNGEIDYVIVEYDC